MLGCDSGITCNCGSNSCKTGSNSTKTTKSNSYDVENFTTYVKTESGVIYKIYPDPNRQFNSKNPYEPGYYHIEFIAVIIDDTVSIPEGAKIYKGIVTFESNGKFSYVLK